MSALAFITLRSPELAANESVSSFIALADSQTSKTVFGDDAIGEIGTKREFAVALRAMHLMAKNGSSSSGIVQSESEGELSRTYKVDASLARRFPDLMGTEWGRELAELISSVVVPVLTSRG